MKKIKLIKIIFTLLIIFGVTGCIVTNIHPTPYLEEEDSGIMFGAIDPTNIPAGGTWASVRAVIDANFDNVNGSLDSIEVTLSEYGDSITNYSADIQLRLLKSDTTSMLANYTRNGELNSALAAKVNVSDTATMLGNYTRNGELASALTAKVSVSDTASMLAHYALTSELGDAGTSIGDVRDEIADSLNALRPLYVAVADTASMLTNYLLASEFAVLETRVDSIVDVLADTANLETVLQVDLDTDTLATKAYARSVGGGGTAGITLNSGTLTLDGSGGTADDITFYTNGNGSYDLPAGGGNLTIMSQVQGWINDTADVIRSEARMIDDTSPYFVFGAGIGEPADSIFFAKGKRGFGAFKVTQDSLHIVDLRNIVISANDSLLFNVYYGNRMTATPVDSLFTGPQSCGDNQTTFIPNNQSTIAPGNDVWIELRADQPEGYRPKEWNLQLNAQIRRL